MVSMSTHAPLIPEPLSNFNSKCIDYRQPNRLPFCSAAHRGISDLLTLMQWQKTQEITKVEFRWFRLRRVNGHSDQFNSRGTRPVYHCQQSSEANN